jgi:hypothetical protein
MAIIKLGTAVVGIRGTIGGTTYSANASGCYAKAWSRPPSQNTPAQNAVRARITTFGAAWSGMSDGERTGWRDLAATPPENDYNSLGELFYLTGWQWFTRIQQRRLSVGQAVDTTLPGSSGVAMPASLTLDVHSLPAGPFSLTWPSGTFPAGDAAIAFLAFHPSQGLESMTTRFLQVLALINPNDTTEDIADVAYDLFGQVQTSWMAHVHLLHQRADGVRSTAIVATGVVA